MHVLPSWFMRKYHILYRDVMYEEETNEQMEINVDDFHIVEIRNYIREYETVIKGHLVI